jgi:hypothetical protein
MVMRFKKSKLGMVEHLQVYGILYPISLKGLLFFVLIFAGSALITMGLVLFLTFAFYGRVPLLDEEFNLVMMLMVTLVLSTFVSINLFNKLPLSKTKKKF